MSRPRRILSAAAALALAAAGANLLDPYLFAVRAWAPIAIVMFGCIGLLLCWRGVKRSRLLILLWAAVPVSALAAKGTFYWREHAVLSSDTPEAAMLGRHFIVGYTSFREVERLAERGLIGGVILDRRNVEGRGRDAVRAEIAALQAVRHRAGLPPLFVTTDQEGGAVSHLSPLLPALPPLAALAGSDDKARQAAWNYGATQGQGLSDLGVTVDFAPVLDLKPPYRLNPFDTNTVIGRRAISADPAITGAIGLAYARGLASAGITPTVKHFPGLGRVTVDTHHLQASLDTPKPELERTDWRPFRAVLSGSNAFLMVGHVRVDAIDPDHPASTSRRVIHDLIRGEWGFHGVVVTDDLVMGAIYHYGLCDAVVNSLNAGADLLLVAYDGRQYYRAMACALDAARRGRLDDAALKESVGRLDRALSAIEGVKP